MKSELIEQITKIEDFLEPLELNGSEEILFTLIQLIDIRDDREVSDETVKRLFSKVNQREFLSIGSDDLMEKYMILIGTFIGGFMQFFFEEMERVPESQSEAIRELISLLGEKISTEEIASLYDGLIQKLQLIQKNSVLVSEPMVANMIKGIFAEESREKLLNASGEEFSSFVVTVTLSLVALIEENRDETEWNIDENMEIKESLAELEDSLRGAIDESNLCDDATFEYALGDKAICNICEKEYKGVKRHLNSCIEKKFEKGSESLYYLIVRSEFTPHYLHISMKASATLEDLDAYIREVWMECCGHMSDFSIRGAREQLSLNSSIEKIFSSTDRVDYVYDYGSSSELVVEFVKEFKGRQSTLIKTLSRNPHIRVVCQACKKRDAVAVCSQCVWDEKGYLCSKCMPKHDCGMDMLLPYVNSPRTGVCAYGSWEDVVGLSQKEMKKIAEEW